MREIKFRAWDNQLKRFSDDGTVCLNRCGHMFVLHNTEYTSIEQSAYTLLQYTGLKDKNGKDIYEGDIVKIFNRDANLATIQWDNGEGGFTLMWLTPKSEDTGGIIAHVDRRGVEVIGNIYENSELLKEHPVIR